MKVNTIPGAAYALTCTAACSVQALLSDASCLTVLETENSGQYIFVAPTDAVEVSDEHALVTQTFKVAALGLAAQGGIRLGEDAVLKNLTAEASTFPEPSMPTAVSMPYPRLRPEPPTPASTRAATPSCPF